MLKIRIIPCLDVKDGRVVKGVNFVNLVDAGDPVAVLTRLDREREPYHRAVATLTIDVDDLDPEQVADAVLAVHDERSR